VEYCLFTEPQEGFDYDDQLAFALAAERLGFDAYFRSDHYLRMAPGEDRTGGTDAWTTLAGLARETSTIRLGTLVSSATHRVPGVLAVQVAQVDRMSGGRVEFGLGTGWFEREHRAYGIPFPAKRFGILEEQLEIITGMWATPVGGRFDFAGEHYRVEDSPALPKPVQSRVPVIIGGGGPSRTPAIAARFATEFNIGFTSEERVAEKFAGVRAACERIGRDPGTLKLSVAVPVLAAASEADLERRATNIGRSLEDFRATAGNVAGGRDEIVAKVERLRALGAERVYLQLLDLRDLEQVEFLGTEVLPSLPR
jgi:F420-dependent oxidoreductase-like protein